MRLQIQLDVTRDLMNKQTAGRNAPCPCGSGRKFKHCCLDKNNGAATAGAAADISEALRQTLEGREFSSMEDAQIFVSRYMEQQNQQALEDFHGLSPEQMHRTLSFPFDSPELIHLPRVLETDPNAPVLQLFSLLAEAIGEQGLKPTAKGNLPRNFCRNAALSYWGEAGYQEHTRFGGINREEDFADLHIARLAAEMSGLVRKYKGRFILSRACRRSLASDGLRAVYPQLFRTYVEEFNWAYRDGYPELRFIQSGFLFSLYLLAKYGDCWRSQMFYEEALLRAFPNLLDEVPELPFSTPEETIRSCYTWRTFVNFAAFFGLAAVEPVSDDYLNSEHRIKALPLLGEAVQFRVFKD